MKDPIRAVVVDDSKIERSMMRMLIDSQPALKWVGDAENGASAEPLIRAEKPDVLFLDVQMPGIDGFELFRRLDAPPKVVLVSASPGHALRAFTVEAVDYLLKPVSEDRFASTLRRLLRIFNLEVAAEVRHESDDRICLRTTGGTLILPLREISALEADGNFSWAHVAGSPRILVCRSLGEFDALLPPHPFVRLDRSIIINVMAIQRIDRISRNVSHVWLKGAGDPLAVGRTAADRLRELLKRKG